jgi:hypothetical protein
MTETVTVTRYDYDHPVTNPDTGKAEYPGTEVYSGAGKVRPMSGRGTGTAGDTPLSMPGYMVSVPLTATDVRAGDVVTFPAPTDPWFTGRTLKVLNVVAGTYVTARRLECQEALS